MVNTPLKADKVWIKNISLNISSSSMQGETVKKLRKLSSKHLRCMSLKKYFYNYNANNKGNRVNPRT